MMNRLPLIAVTALLMASSCSAVWIVPGEATNVNMATDNVKFSGQMESYVLAVTADNNMRGMFKLKDEDNTWDQDSIYHSFSNGMLVMYWSPCASNMNVDPTDVSTFVLTYDPWTTSDYNVEITLLTPDTLFTISDYEDVEVFVPDCVDKWTVVVQKEGLGSQVYGMNPKAYDDWPWEDFDRVDMDSRTGWDSCASDGPVWTEDDWEDGWRSVRSSNGVSVKWTQTWLLTGPTYTSCTLKEVTLDISAHWEANWGPLGAFLAIGGLTCLFAYCAINGHLGGFGGLRRYRGHYDGPGQQPPVMFQPAVRPGQRYEPPIPTSFPSDNDVSAPPSYSETLRANASAPAAGDSDAQLPY